MALPDFERVRELVRKELIQVVRDPRLLRMVIVAPILQLLAFGYAVSTDVRATPTNVVDQTFASGGFSGGWYRNQPWIVDEHINPTGTEGVLFFLNEDYYELCINQNGDFEVGDFQQPTNQFVITSLIYWAGNLICTNPQLQAKFTALTA